MTALDATCAWVNPGLVLVAVTVALLDLTLAAQRWTALHPAPPALVGAAVAVAAERCFSVPAPELRDMARRD